MENFKFLTASNLGTLARYNFHFQNNHTIYYYLSLSSIYIGIKMLYNLLD